MNPATLAHYMGIVPKWVDNTQVGGTSFLIHMRHAAAAIASGLATTILCTMGQKRAQPRRRGRSAESARRARSSGPRYDGSYPGQFESIYGVLGPTTMFGMGVLRYMKETGTTIEQLASVAVAQRKWSNKVPRAMFQQLVTVEEVLEQPDDLLPVPPVHVLPGNGRRRRVHPSPARTGWTSFQPSPVYILGTGESVETPVVSQMYDMTSSAAFKTSGAKAFEEAQVSHDDIDHIQIYDAFAHLPIYGLEDLGFVGRGEAGAFIEEGNTSPGGKLPLNTNGGGLSYTHTGYVRNVRHAGIGAPGQGRGRPPGRGRQDVLLPGRRRNVHGCGQPHLHE